MTSVSLEDFKKVELRVARITAVEDIPGADRLWKLSIDAGETKTIVAGIKKFYPRESLIGRSIVVVHNLAPAVIRGVESNGMLLAAKEGDRLSLLTPDTELAPGSPIG